MFQAVCQGTVLAESDQTVKVEGNRHSRRRPGRRRRDPQRPAGLMPRGEPGPERRPGKRSVAGQTLLPR